MVEDLLAARGIIVSPQAVRLWAEKFGRHFAKDIRRRSSAQLGDTWHLDEAVISIRGEKHSGCGAPLTRTDLFWRCWCKVAEMPKAANRLMRKLLKSQGRAPRVMITDKLRSYDAAKL